jgi:hypothetical protein
MRANRLRAAVRPSIIGPPRLPALPDLTRRRRRHFAGVPVGLLVHVRPTPATSTAFPRVLPPGPRTASPRRSTLAITCDSWLLHSNTGANGRGRDEDCSSPPAQILACAAGLLPPRPTPEVANHCSIASAVLWPHPTSHPRTCSAFGFAAKHDACVVLIGSGAARRYRPSRLQSARHANRHDNQNKRNLSQKSGI